MDLLVRNAEGNVPEKQRSYAAKKLGRLSRYFNKATKVEMVHHQQKGKHRLDVTIFADEFKLRGSESDSSLRACIDKVSEKLEVRLRKLKHRLVHSHREKGTKKLPEALAEITNAQPKPPKSKMSTTRIAVKTMSPEEAALQMDLVNEPFYAFHNAVSGKPSVIYKLKAGAYGLAELDL